MHEFPFLDGDTVVVIVIVDLTCWLSCYCSIGIKRDEVYFY